MSKALRGSRSHEPRSHRGLTEQVTLLLDKAVAVPSASIEAHVHMWRRRRPDASPAEIIAILEREYLALVASAGAAVGAAAAIPVVGTGTGLALTTGDVVAFFAASAAFSLAVASVHGIAVTDTDRRRALLLSTILGETGVRAVSDAAEVSTLQVGRVLLTRMPLGTVKKVNGTLTRKFIQNQAARQTSLAVGRLLPYGVGAVIGAAGGRALGRTVVDGARAAFGPPPARFTDMIELPAQTTKPELPH